RRWRWWRRRRRRGSTPTERLGRRRRRGAVEAARGDQRVTHIRATRERGGLDQRRLTLPRTTRGIGGRRNRRVRGPERILQLATSKERVPTTELEEPTTRHTTTRHVVRRRQTRARRPRVGRDVVVLTVRDHRIRGVTATSHIHVATQDRRARTTNSMR